MKINVLVNVVCNILLLFVVNISHASEVADKFILPVDGYNVVSDTCLNWGGKNDQFPGKKHVGDDYCIAVNTPVKAVANGVVKHIFYDPTDKTGFYWIGYVITEHTLSSGKKVSVIYGHVKPIDLEVGMEVSVGQKIGEVVSYPYSSDHIHFGVYMGTFIINPSNSPYPDVYTDYPAAFYGYLLEAAWPGKYVNPYDFITTFSSWSPGFDTVPYNSTEENIDVAVEVKEIVNDGVLNPGVESPVFSTGQYTKNTIISFDAKIISPSPINTTEAVIWVKNGVNGSWDYYVPTNVLMSTNGVFNHYEINLQNVVGIPSSNFWVQQISAELSDSSRVGDIWQIKNFEIQSFTTDRAWSANTLTNWNFKEAIPQGIVANEFLRVNSTNSRPAIVSPLLGLVSSDFTGVEVLYSVDDLNANINKTAIGKMYYDIGNGFDNTCSSQDVNIVMDNKVHDFLFVIPSCAVGKTQKVQLVLFYDDTYDITKPFNINLKQIAFQKTMNGITNNVSIVNNMSSENSFPTLIPIDNSTDAGGQPPEDNTETQPSTPTYASPYNLSASALSSISVKASWTCPANASSCIVSLVNRQTNQVVGPFYKTNGTSADVAQTFTFNSDSQLFHNTEYEAVVQAQYLVTVGGTTETRTSEPVGGFFVTTLSPASVAGNAINMILCDEQSNFTCTNEKSSFKYAPSHVYLEVKLENAYSDTLYMKPRLYAPNSNVNLTADFGASGNYEGGINNQWHTFFDFAEAISEVVDRIGVWKVYLYCGNTVDNINQYCGETAFDVGLVTPILSEATIESVILGNNLNHGIYTLLVNSDGSYDVHLKTDSITIINSESGEITTTSGEGGETTTVLIEKEMLDIQSVPWIGTLPVGIADISSFDGFSLQTNGNYARDSYYFYDWLVTTVSPKTHWVTLWVKFLSDSSNTYLSFKHNYDTNGDTNGVNNGKWRRWGISSSTSFVSPFINVGLDLLVRGAFANLPNNQWNQITIDLYELGFVDGDKLTGLQLAGPENDKLMLFDNNIYFSSAQLTSKDMIGTINGITVDVVSVANLINESVINKLVAGSYSLFVNVDKSYDLYLNDNDNNNINTSVLLTDSIDPLTVNTNITSEVTIAEEITQVVNIQSAPWIGVLPEEVVGDNSYDGLSLKTEGIYARHSYYFYDWLISTVSPENRWINIPVKFLSVNDSLYLSFKYNYNTNGDTGGINNGKWRRWGISSGSSFAGPWIDTGLVLLTRGTSANLPINEWLIISIDLYDLGFIDGDELTGLQFAGPEVGNILFDDEVWFTANRPSN